MNAEPAWRIVVFTCGDLGIAAGEAISRIRGIDSVTVVRAPYHSTQRTGLDRLWYVVKYNGLWGAVCGLWRSGVRRLGHATPEAFCVEPPSLVPVLAFNDFHDPACIEALKDLKPDLGVVVGTYILKQAVFSIPRLGSINLHTGKAPEYRGSAPAFWELYNGESRVGVTVHRVAEEVDAGGIIRQELFPLDRAPSGDALAYIRQYRQDVLYPNGLRLLVEAVEDMVSGRAAECPQDPAAARTYRLPTHRQKRQLQRKVKRRRRMTWKHLAKRSFGWLLFNTGLYRRFLDGKAIIVLFHRVDDRYARNPISCTTSQFEQYCAFFSRYFDVISVSELVELLERGADLSGKLVITFDDGYADNVAAARTLRRYGMPACFFVATDFIGTERDGWWDVDQGHRSYWMDWDDIRQLSDWGFEIGAHTCSHVDLGVVKGDEAADEVSRSKVVLESQLGRRIDHFAYPYGRRESITEENVTHVQNAGFRTCLSAFGGFVNARSNLYDLHRYAVSPWHRSPWQLGLEMLLEPWAGTRKLPLPGHRLETVEAAATLEQ